ncbi:MAG TPA: hypothetical protein ENI94_03650 [Gammaproteobacteria bacterium]|nr:hypothetical protein [Gammaproteobacteria bacterium]
MTKCPDISGLQFSKPSKEAIEDIQRIRELGNLLTSVVAGSTVVKIFSSYGVRTLEVAYNISSYEWAAWAQAMGSIDYLEKARVQRIAYLHLLDNKTTLTTEEVKFWEAVVHGCH